MSPIRSHVGFVMRNLSSQFWETGRGSRGEVTGAGDEHKGMRLQINRSGELQFDLSDAPAHRSDEDSEVVA